MFWPPAISMRSWMYEPGPTVKIFVGSEASISC